MKVLVINAGSSSLKYQLLDPDTKDVLAKGLCERIGIDGHIKHTPTGGDVYDADRYMPDHEAAIKLVMEVLTHNYYGVIKICPRSTPWATVSFTAARSSPTPSSSTALS